MRSRLMKSPPAKPENDHPEWRAFFTLLFEMEDTLDAHRLEVKRQEVRFNTEREKWVVQTRLYFQSQAGSPPLRTWIFPNCLPVTRMDRLSSSNIVAPC